MGYLQTIFLGIVQGLTEWLPISSSGHLVIIQNSLGIEAPLIFDILLHLGTLLAVFVIFWQDILKILLSLIKLNLNDEHGKLAIYIFIGSIPIAVVGYVLHDFFASLFNSSISVGIALLTTGLFIYFSKFYRESRTLDSKESFLIGIAQAVSIVPGISRSGFTITTGLLRGIERGTIFRFSFLLSVPAIIGANVFELTRVSWAEFEIGSMLVGTSVAAIIGYLSLKLLMRLVLNQKFHFFSFYCVALGLLILATNLN
ncbi:undecaprenyl-diphosphate phosphatase [Chloroflexota bacterium]